jgi:hypothetical protein
MTKLKTLSAAIILSAAIATPVFAQPTHHSHVRHFRGAYNQMIEPYAIPQTHGGWNLENYEFNRSFPGGEDPSNNPSGS